MVTSVTTGKTQLADKVHDQIGEASELLEANNLDAAAGEILRRAADHAEMALQAIKDAICSLPEQIDPMAVKGPR